MRNETALRLLLTMNELLPIIRRKRRPLIVVDVPAVVVAPVVAKPEAGKAGGEDGRLTMEDGKGTARKDVRPAKAAKSKSHDDAAQD